MELFIFIGVIVVVLFMCLFTVQGKQAAILETFGRPHAKAYMAGLHIKLPPPFTFIVGRISLQIQQITAQVSVKTLDNAFLQLPVTVQYRASDTPDEAVRAFYELEDPRAQITSYILANMRQSVAEMDMNEVYQNRDRIQKDIEVALADKFRTFGYYIHAVLVDEPTPSPEVQDAFNRVVASVRLKEAAINEAEAARIKLVGAARAEAESKQLQGQGLADMRNAIATGMQEAMAKIRAAAPDITSAEVLAFLTDTNRLDVITTAAETGNLIILDTRESNMANSIAAVKAAKLQTNDTPPSPWK